MQKRRKKSKTYFGRAAQEAVEEFLLVETDKERHRIFNTRLHAPFSKLVENIVFTYKFINLDESVEDLQLECLSHIYLNIHKYKPDKGKAYSYFGTMVKNYLIQKSIRLSKQKNIYVTDEVTENWAEQLNMPHKTLIDETDALNSELIEILIKDFDQHLPNIKNHNEKKVVQAIIYLLEHRQEIDLFNKKQLYVLLREITNLSTKRITSSLARLKQRYFSLRHNFLEEGY